MAEQNFAQIARSFVFCIIVGLCAECRAAKIILIPMSHSSHVRFFSTAGKALQEAGHEVKKMLAEDNGASEPAHFDFKFGARK